MNWSAIYIKVVYNCRQFSSVCSYFTPPHKYRMQFSPINQPRPIVVSTLTLTLAISNLVSLAITKHNQPFFLVLLYQPKSTLLSNLTTTTLLIWFLIEYCRLTSVKDCRHIKFTCLQSFSNIFGLTSKKFLCDIIKIIKL